QAPFSTALHRPSPRPRGASLPRVRALLNEIPSCLKHDLPSVPEGPDVLPFALAVLPLRVSDRPDEQRDHHPAREDSGLHERPSSWTTRVCTIQRNHRAFSIREARSIRKSPRSCCCTRRFLSDARHQLQDAQHHDRARQVETELRRQVVLWEETAQGATWRRPPRCRRCCVRWWYSRAPRLRGECHRLSLFASFQDRLDELRR
ncbi:hypothetical protein T310_8837, partial [Rasamsonia emersonii CBS 393.64]